MRSRAGLNKFDTYEPGVGAHNFGLPLDAGAFEKRQSESAKQVG